MIYFDNAATTKPDLELVEQLNKTYHDYFMNANSPYNKALNIYQLQNKSRDLILNLLKLNQHQLIYTSGGTESNNMAIKGICMKYAFKNKHLITSKVEHSSVYECFKQLEDMFGFEVTYLDVNEYGKVSNEDILKNIKDNTILISIMKVNSETGAINDIEDIYDNIKNINKDILIHSDCVQALGKVNVNYDKLDLISCSMHKIHGFKGSGLLLYKNKINLTPLIIGGSQENSLRGGTSNYHYNILMAKTIRKALDRFENKIDDVKKMSLFLKEELLKNDKIIINDNHNGSCFITNISICDYPIEIILNALENEEIYVSTQSACAKKNEISRVQQALKIDDRRKRSALRISIDYSNNMDEVKMFVEKLNEIIGRLG